MHFSTRLFALLLFLCTSPLMVSAAPPSDTPRPVKEGEVNLFDDALAPLRGDDLPEEEGGAGSRRESDEDKYKRGRMAFLFGQYDIAYDIWQPMASQGHPKAQASLGWMHHIGKGAKKSFRSAYDWYEKAANQNHPIALNNLGVFHEQGLGVAKSMRQAFKWYKESAEWGYSYGQYNLGILYKTGRGVKKNTNKAIYWLELATLQGVEQAQAALENLSKTSGDSHPAQTTSKKNTNKSRKPARRHRR